VTSLKMACIKIFLCVSRHWPPLLHAHSCAFSHRALPQNNNCRVDLYTILVTFLVKAKLQILPDVDHTTTKARPAASQLYSHSTDRPECETAHSTPCNLPLRQLVHPAPDQLRCDIHYQTTSIEKPRLHCCSPPKHHPNKHADVEPSLCLDPSNPLASLSRHDQHHYSIAKPFWRQRKTHESNTRTDHVTRTTVTRPKLGVRPTASDWKQYHSPSAFHTLGTNEQTQQR